MTPDILFLVVLYHNVIIEKTFKKKKIEKTDEIHPSSSIFQYSNLFNCIAVQY